MIYSLYWEKEVIKKVCNNNYRLLLNLTDKTNLKEVINMLPYQNLGIFYTWKNKKNSYKNNKF